MQKEAALKLIEQLSNANGVSGFEEEVGAIGRSYGEKHGTVKEDSVHNLYIERHQNNGQRCLVQLDAHLDEVGFIVQAIKPNGTLRFLTVGGWVPYNVPAHKVRVRNQEGKYITGIVTSKPPHFMTQAEREKTITIEDMVIDIGATSAEEVIQDYKIGIGAPVVPDTTFEYRAEKDLMLGKAFDCRIGCAALLNTLDEVQNADLNVDIVATLTTQEEVGLRGAKVAAQNVLADLAIVFEGCPADDTFTEDYLIQTGLRKGPMLRHFDVSMITNPRFQKYALDIAKRYNIPVQEAVRSGGGNNGAAINGNKKGTPAIVIGIPVRYAHTHYGYVAYEDYQHAVELAVNILKDLDEATIRSF